MREQLVSRVVFVLALACSLSFVAVEPTNAQDFDSAQAAYDRRDYETAAALLRPLVEQAQPNALNLMGLMHHLGRGVVEDDGKAFDYFERAAAAGLVDARYNRANMLMYGYGVPGDITEPETEAVKDYVEAATAGHADAQYTLGLLLLSGKILRQDTTEALKWMTRAAEQGNLEAKRFLSP